MGLGFQKPVKRSTVKRRKQRIERIVKQSIRAQCVERDGHCRVGKDYDDYTSCSGPSEWCHFGSFKRAHTRGLEPGERHTTRGSFMGCRAHHREYDSGRLGIHAFDADLGCDGPLVYTT